MYNPITTYRIQFHKEFNLDQFEQVIPYLQQLGIGTLYASPVFASTPGSTHGYDALDSNSINAEIGTEAQLRTIARQLRLQGIGWLQDIVPNHMSFDSRNPWLLDVLEKGKHSQYANYFDIAWDGANGKLMVPFLGVSLQDALQNDELKLAVENGRLFVKYYEAGYPLTPHSYQTVLAAGAQKPDAIAQLLQQMQDIKQTEEPKAHAQQWDEWLKQLAGLMKNEKVHQWIDAQLQAVNGDKEKLRALLEEQHYRLCHWQETDGAINYRRFFTVNGLICLNIQDKEVLQEHHRLIKQLVEEGVLQGLRIDHVDGLYDPTKYLEELRSMMGEGTYTIVEKILEPGEELPTYWPIQGTSGYEFLALVNNLLTQKSSEEPFTQFYNSLVNDHRTLPQQVRDKKAHILYHHMGGELENLYQLLMNSGLIAQEDFAQMRTEDIKTAIAEVLIHCPVYRFYGNSLPLDETETGELQKIFAQVKAGRPDLTGGVDLLEGVILHRPQQRGGDYQKAALHFYQRLMQFTGPLMAKGVEDTLMYTYNRFIGHNEVGDSPEAFGIAQKAFHQAMQQRQQQWPLALNATATHDTKRGEDARARLNVLTDLPNEWLKAVEEWMEGNQPLKKGGAPDRNDEYFIYQTIVAQTPKPPKGGLSNAQPSPVEEAAKQSELSKSEVRSEALTNSPLGGLGVSEYASRLSEYLQKALREAKRHSNWTTPNEAYEKATKEFAVALLDPSTAFWKSFEPLLHKVAEYGVVNSLVQTVLKFMCPGVPDVYQGCELWDFSFVDPDNRRPVDYALRQEMLQELEAQKEDENFLQQLWEDRSSGKIKLWLVQQLSLLRKQKADFFAKADYVPLKIKGKYSNNVFAFARKGQRTWYVVVLPLNIAALCEKQKCAVTEIDWADTKLLLPDGVRPQWEHLLTGVGDEHEKEISIQHLFAKLPFALLKGKQAISERGAGVLLHISSLPSPFGIGDLGPEAYAFADFLYRSNQKYWQLLPLNPTEAGQGHSPYSSISSMAGNYLFISPQLLVKEGLLEAGEMQAAQLPQKGKTDYAEAERVKKALLHTAWQKFKTGINSIGGNSEVVVKVEGDTSLHQFAAMQNEFEVFCEGQKEWLNDFAVYAVLKQAHNGQPWYEWPDELKNRDEAALEKLRSEHADEILFFKWQQFLFDKQWKALKTYCHEREIGLVGDMPFYVSYDSADVWAHRSIFKLDEGGNRLGMAGVPPDAFSDDGQLWGMPVFDWEALKEQNYEWWIQRLRKNIELFDVVRLDHFRAFAGYWEVPAGETTARNGEWKTGPGAPFFEAVQQAFGKLPFIAEDLGEITPDVLQLRDQFNLPGMRILQFAFDENIAKSDYIPHNYTRNSWVYTGTHDNNTTRGWFNDELNEETRHRIMQYVGRHISDADVAHALCRLAFGSVANTAVIPLQDLLELDSNGRMNKPGAGEDNWGWRLLPGQLHHHAEEALRRWTELFNRE
jgi:malto-oligosyltrehalose synthase/4-alpha-glucanotransferase